MEEDAVVGVTSNPTIFQAAIAEGDAYDEQLRESSARDDDAKEIFLRAGRARHPGRVRRPAARVGRRRRARRLRVASRSTRRSRTTRDATIEEALRLYEWVDRPNLFVKIPATEPGPRRDRGVHRARRVDQRHADLLAGAPPRGHGGLPARAGAARRRRRRPVAGRLGRELLRLARRHGDRQAAGGDRHARRRSRCAASSRSRTPSSPTRATRSSSPAAAGRRSPQRGATPQRLPLGLHVDQEPGLPGRPLRREPHRARTRWTRCRARRSGPSRTTASWRPTLEQGARRGASGCSTTSSASGVDYDDVSACSRRRACKKFADSFEQLLEGVRAKRAELAPV